MNKKLSIQKNMLYNSIGTIFYFGCQWIITILAVNLGSFESGGYFSLAISITNIFACIALYGIRNYQVSDVSNKFASETYVTTRVITSIFALILCVGFVLLNKEYSLQKILCIVFYMIFRVSEAIADVFQGIQQKAERMDYIAVSLVSRGFISITSFSLGMIVTKNIFISIVLMPLCSFLFILFFDVKLCEKMTNIHFNLDVKNISILLRDCFPLMITNILMTSIASVPRYFLEKQYGIEVMGIYSSVATPAVIIQSLSVMIYAPLTTLFADSYCICDKEKYKKILIKTTLFMGILSLLFLLGGWLFGEFGLLIFFGAKIRAYVYLFVPVIITTILISFIYYLTMILTVSRRMIGITIANLIAVAIACLTANFFVKNYSMSGVNYCLYVAVGVDVLVLTGILCYDYIKHFGERNFGEHE